MKNLYNILGVKKDSSQSDIKKAFRKKAKNLHPDKNPNKDTSEEMADLTHAYEILSDPVKRLNYDKYGETDSINPIIENAKNIILDLYFDLVLNDTKVNNISEKLRNEIAQSITRIKLNVDNLNNKIKLLEKAKKENY